MTEVSEEEQKKIIGRQVKGFKTIWIGQPTQRFEDDFDKLQQLGEPGQFGVTFRCRNKSTKATYAVKVLSKNRFYRIPLEHRNRFLRAMHDEIEILATLRHDNIIKLEKVYEDKPYLYIVMEECTGGELFQRIVSREKYSESDAAPVIKQLLSALKFMHEVHEIVHCDLKPDNILFLDKTETSLLKIIDFGMSKVLPRLQYLTHLCGTPYYTAPEIVAAKKYNHQADVWSVGVILYVMLFGYPPFYVDPQVYGNRERSAIYEKIKKGFTPKVRDTNKVGFGPWFPSHIPVSAAVKDLISHLLVKDVSSRFSANEGLNHPWILKGGVMVEDSVEKPIIPKEMLTTLAKFSNTCQFKLVVVKLFRKEFQRMRPHHFNQLEKIFEKMDADGDGIVSYEEFEKALSSIPQLPISNKEIRAMFKELNVGEMKGIRFEDLLNAVVHDYLVACDERLYAAFAELDTDDDGCITVKELKDKLKELDPLGEWEVACKLIEEQALDKGGLIDYEEFLVSLHPKFDEPPVWLPALHLMKSTKQNEESQTEIRSQPTKPVEVNKSRGNEESQTEITTQPTKRVGVNKSPGDDEKQQG